MDKEEWSAGIESELAFWSQWARTKGGDWPKDYEDRINPDLPLQDHIANLLKGFDGELLRVLDVGSGPMTILGKKFRGKEIDLTAVDALADIYRRIEFPLGLPLVKPRRCDSEKLVAEFGENVFDLTHARNTLDHGYDPILAIREMIAVTKPGGFIATEHAANEAVTGNWNGFHQWNFHVEDRDLKVSNKTSVYSVRDSIGDTASFVELPPDGENWIFCVLKKRA